MSAHMLVLKNDSTEERQALIARYIRRLRMKLGRTDGYYGASAWQSCEKDDEVMILIEFRDDWNGERALQAFSKDKLALDEVSLSDRPADITVFDLEANRGLRPSDAPVGTFLSLSRRIAPPGFGEDLELELDSIFGYLAVLPGYLGHVYGSHYTLTDEVLGIVLWDSEESFARSVPESTPYELKLYRRVQ